MGAVSSASDDRDAGRGGPPLSVLGETLLDSLRVAAGAHAPPRGCRDGRCGACLVELDGVLVRACHVTAASVSSTSVLRLARDVSGDEAARAALDHFAFARPTRCRLCVGALALTAAHLRARAAEGRAPAEPSEVRAAACTIRCVCTGAGSIERALQAGLLPK